MIGQNKVLNVNNNRKIDTLVGMEGQMRMEGMQRQQKHAWGICVKKRFEFLPGAAEPTHNP